MKKRATTIHDIAKLLNITASTVSRALNDHPRISDATKKRVKEAAKELNYRPNTIAANLRMGKGNTIGVIVPVINRHFFANIIHGIESVMDPAGYNLIICSSNESLEKEARNLQTLISNRVSGIMVSISAETRNADHFESVFRAGIPVIQFDRAIDGVSAAVVNDDFQGAYDTVKHLIEAGYRNIAHFAGPAYIVNYNRRLEGYKQALSDHNIPYREEFVFEGVISREKGRNTTEQIIDHYPSIDAIFAASDMSALGALLMLKKRGIPVPEKFGVCGYVNEPFGEYLDPSLTSTEQFGEQIGITAAKELLQCIDAEKKSDIHKLMIPPKLIIRKSSNR